MIRCKNCYLWKSSNKDLIFTNFTEGIGNKKSKVMLVFDNIFLADILEDKFFSDTNYKNLLSTFLVDTELKVEDLYITSLIKCYPSDTTKKPTKPAIHKCFESYLKQEIKEVNPKVIVLCGKEVIKFFLPEAQNIRRAIKNLKDIVGKSFYSHTYNAYFVPVYNFYYLSNLNAYAPPKKQTYRAFKNIKYLLNKDYQDFKIDVLNDYSAIKHLGNTIGLDLEATGVDFTEDKILTIGLSDLKLNLSFDVGVGKGILWDKIIPEIKKRKLCIHHAKYDGLMLKATGETIQDNVIGDSMLMAFLLNPLGALNLEFLVKLQYGVTYKDVIDREHMADVDPEIRRVYCGKDSYFHKRLAIDLMTKLKEKGSEKSYKVFLEMMKVLVDLEYRGILIDKPKFNFLRKHYSDLKIEAETAFKKKFKLDEKFNLNSSKQLGELLFDKLGLPIIKYTKPKKSINKKPSTEKEVIKGLLSKNKNLQYLLDYTGNEGKLRKLKTYEEHIKKDGRIHSQFKQISPDSSRVMSSKPNIQNVDRGSKLKELFIAPKGYTFVYFDFDQIEFRIWVHLSGDEKGIEFINAGRDIHSFIAKRFWKLPEPEEEIKKIYLKKRELVKDIVYGTLYGRTPQSIAYEHKVPLEEAQGIQRLFFSICRKGYFYMKDLEQKILKDKYIKTPFGTYKYFPDIDLVFGNKREHQLRSGKNFIVQSGAVEIEVFPATINIRREVIKQKLDACFVHQQHDMGMLEVLDPHVDSVVKIIRVKTFNPVKLSVPITASIKVGKTWADLKTLTEDK